MNPLTWTTSKCAISVIIGVCGIAEAYGIRGREQASSGGWDDRNIIDRNAASRVFAADSMPGRDSEIVQKEGVVELWMSLSGQRVYTLHNTSSSAVLVIWKDVPSELKQATQLEGGQYFRLKAKGSPTIEHVR
jgi:hypothetical protein